MKDTIKKIRDAVADMQSKVRFVNKGRSHLYLVNGTDEALQGVSTVSNIIPKDWLSAWGAKEAVKFLGYSDYEDDIEKAKEMLVKISVMEDPKEFIKLLKEAKGASSRKSSEALINGSAGHKWLESYVKAKMANQPIPEMPLGTLKRPIEQFLAWESANISTWVLSEERVAYPEKKYAGTLDGLAYMKDGRLALIDYKFASHISPDYKLQCAGYQACFEMYDIKIDERIIIRLPKTLEKEEWDEKTHKYSMIPNNIEVLILDKNYEWDRDTFFHVLPLKQWVNNEIKNTK